VFIFSSHHFNLKTLSRKQGKFELTLSHLSLNKYKGSSKLQTSERYTLNRDTLSIVKAVESDQGWYTCKGQIPGRSVFTRSSSSVSLTVKGELNCPHKLSLHDHDHTSNQESFALRCFIHTADTVVTHLLRA